ncbi:MAG: hypothetical protein K8S97_01515, partial [Anaerolineae bacterium]|nr:hypothetical protein [Anaerolineae bacterium]
ILILSVIPWLSLHLWWEAIENATAEGGNRVVEDTWERRTAIRLDNLITSRTGDLVYAAPIRVAEEVSWDDTGSRKHGFMISAATLFQLLVIWQAVVAIYRFWATRDVPDEGFNREDSAL